jgi:hypothetical protein
MSAFGVQSGKHMLSLSFSGFAGGFFISPRATLEPFNGAGHVLVIQHGNQSS